MPDIRKSRPTHLFARLTCIFLFLLLLFPELAGEAARTALARCAAVIVPTLFPYTVLSTLLVRLGTLDRIPAPLTRCSQRLLCLPGSAIGAFVLGTICGFPIGAKIACDLCRTGEIRADEAQRLIPLASCAGPAFVIEVVGTHAFGSRAFGIFLYAAQLIVSVLVALCFVGRRGAAPEYSTGSLPSPKKSESILTVLSDSVAASAVSTLQMCGFLVFFAVILRLIGALLDAVSLSALLPPLSAILECTAGSAEGAAVGGAWGGMLSGFSLGFCGISVLAQMQLFSAPAGLSLRPAVCQKLLCGLLLGILSAAALPFFHTAEASLPCFAPLPELPQWVLPAEITLLILSCLFPILPRHKTQKRS